MGLQVQIVLAHPPLGKVDFLAYAQVTKSNKYIIKVYTISFHLIPNTLCLTGGATKIDF